jgi:intracellular multiplication protein IcmC
MLLKYVTKLSIMFLLLGVSSQAMAAVSFDQMMASLQSSIEPVQELVTGAAYLIGLMFFLRALYHLKVYGEMRTMMSSDTSVKEPAMYILVGAVFVYLPTFYDIISQTTFGNTNILAYSELSATNSAQYGDALVTVLMLVRLIGVIAFIRGWIILAKGSGKGQQPAWAKGITHILGGIMAINIVGTTQIFMTTFGF